MYLNCWDLRNHSIPLNTEDVGPNLGHRLRRWPNINPTFLLVELPVIMIFGYFKIKHYNISNFHPIKDVGRGGETQLQVGEKRFSD